RLRDVRGHPAQPVPPGSASLPDLRWSLRGASLVDRPTGTAPPWCRRGTGMSSSPQGLPLGPLRRYLAAHLPEARGPVTATLVPGGRSNRPCVLPDGPPRWRLRRPPPGGLTPPAPDVGREYRVVAARHGTDVPVARPVLWCGASSVIGAPFTVVEYV